MIQEAKSKESTGLILRFPVRKWLADLGVGRPESGSSNDEIQDLRRDLVFAYRRLQTLEEQFRSVTEPELVDALALDRLALLRRIQYLRQELQKVEAQSA